MKLTIGMASYNNFQEVWFTLQALRLYQDLADTELLVVDNYGDDSMQQFLAAWLPEVRYIRYTERQGTAAPRDNIFAEASGEWVMVIDSHVMLTPGTVARFRQWTADNANCRDLLQGPLLYDNLSAMADSFQDRWEGEMWGVWNPGHVDDDAEPYEIRMQGLGLFACRRDSWLGFNPAFRGFGGEEGYIHEKYRQAGRKTLCLPFLKWVHHFKFVAGVQSPVPYPLAKEDKIHNYLTGFAELGLDPEPINRTFGVSKPKITNIQIDPNAVCGSKCWFCPVRYEERPTSQVMPQALFTEILDSIGEAVQLGSVAGNYTLWLSSYNDILFDPLLEERLQALRQRGQRFIVLTNGINLVKHVDLLHQYRDVAHCYSVNLPAGNPESYAAHTGNPPELFTQIIEGLRALYIRDPEYYARVVHIGINGAYDDDYGRRQLKYSLPVGDTDNQLRELRRALPMFPRIEAMRPLCDRAGHLAPYSIDNGIHRPQTQGCNRLTEWVHVNTFGDVYTCCQDYSETTVYADLREVSFHQAVTAPHFAALLATRRDLCSKCTFAQ